MNYRLRLVYNIYVWGKGGPCKQKIIVKERSKVIIGAASPLSQNNQ
jgi:hypothetical protein